MVCCWAGDDGKFNNSEKVRAWGVYSTVVILSPVFCYASYRFYKRRNRPEMLIRESRAVVLCPFCVHIWLLFSAMYQLTLNLEEAEEDWSKFVNIRPTSVPETFNLLSFASFAFCAATYLYRVLMFYFRKVRSEEAEGFGEAMIRLSGDANALRTSSWLEKRRNPKWIVALCLLWTVVMMIPTIVFDFVLDSHERELKICSQAIIGVPTLIFEAYLLHILNDTYGVINEYKMLGLLVFLYFGGLFLTNYIPGVHDTYYLFIIDFVSKWLLMSGYYIWLLLYLETFSVENLDSSRPRPVLQNKWSSKILGLKPKISEQPKSCGFEQIPLHIILSNEKQYKLFRHHVQETLCIENLCFFVDIYMHRKNLGYDPFLERIELEAYDIRECAKLELPWIDQKMNPESTPTSRRIYDLYIKPLSRMEVNIPGKTRREIMAVFEDQKQTKRSMFNLELGSIMRLSGRFSNGRESLFGQKKTSRFDIVTPKLKEKESKLSVNSILGPQSTNSGRSSCVILPESSVSVEEPSIKYLYPAWRTLVNLLKNDSLVRFLNRRNTDKWSL